MKISSKEKLKDFMSSDKGRKIIIIAGLAVIVLIFLSGQLSKAGDSTSTENFSVEQYRESLSAEVLSMVQSVDGAGQAKILLTLENSYEYIYLEDKKTLQKINEPKVRGVVVACEGGDSEVLKAEVTELLCTALNISSTKVCITKLT
ncbi:MAG: hypothetical protein ACI4GZ_05530 [Ruminococcus sp.]